MQDGPTISNLPGDQNLTVSTVVVTSPAATITPGSPLVKVLIKYPADWKKDKFFKDGDVKAVSPEAAATFVEIGIATMVDGEKEEMSTEEDPAADDNEGEAIEEEQPATEGKKPKKGK